MGMAQQDFSAGPREQQAFGTAIAVHDRDVYICDDQNGLHQYTLEGGQWQHILTKSMPCMSIKANARWLVVGDYNRVGLLQRETNGLRPYSTVHVHDVNHSCVRQRYRVGHFGDSMALAKDRLYVRGAEACVAVFSLGELSPTLHSVLEIDATGALHKRLEVTGDRLIVGAELHRSPSQASSTASGLVAVYEIKHNTATLQYRLLASETGIQRFGKRIGLQAHEQGGSKLHIGAAGRYYSFDFSSQSAAQGD